VKALVAFWVAYTGFVTAVAAVTVWWLLGSPHGLPEAVAGIVMVVGVIVLVAGVYVASLECACHLRLRWEDEGGTR
jgi:hypothetical protein